mgnify:FL=1
MDRDYKETYVFKIDFSKKIFLKSNELSRQMYNKNRFAF